MLACALLKRSPCVATRWQVLAPSDQQVFECAKKGELKMKKLIGLGIGLMVCSTLASADPLRPVPRPRPVPPPVERPLPPPAPPSYGNGEIHLRVGDEVSVHGTRVSCGDAYYQDPGFLGPPATSQAYFEGQHYSFHVGATRNLEYTTSHSRQRVDLAGQLTSAPYAVVMRDHAMRRDELYIFVRGIDNGMWYRTLDRNWINMGGSATQIHEVRLLRNNDIAVIVRGVDGALWIRTLYSNWRKY